MPRDALGLLAHAPDDEIESVNLESQLSASEHSIRTDVDDGDAFTLEESMDVDGLGANGAGSDELCVETQTDEKPTTAKTYC